MITDWINITRVIITDAERLYPNGLDWQLKPGINAIIGGTGLGKTTFVYALQYGVFSKMIVDDGERIEREFFKNRLTNRPDSKTKTIPPAIEVHFSIEKSSFTIKRNLLTGSIIETTLDGAPLKSNLYESTLAEKIGLKDDFPSITRLQSHLLFFGEDRHLLAWENRLQHELINLLLSDHNVYVHLNKLWEDTESADSEARNISAQASRMEGDIEEMAGKSNVDELGRRSEINQLQANRVFLEEKIAELQRQLKRENALLLTQNNEVTHAQDRFHRNLDIFENAADADLDNVLLKAAVGVTPTAASMRHALEEFLSKPTARPCPCCGRAGLAVPPSKLAEIVAIQNADGNCIVCNKEMLPRQTASSIPMQSAPTDQSASELQGVLFKREQTKSRVENLSQEEQKALAALAKARADEAEFLRSNPASAIDTLRLTVQELRKRQNSAEERRDKTLVKLRRKLTKTNATFTRIQKNIAKAFKKYASLYLDEPCGVAFLKEGALPGKKGPQVKAPHAAFFPVVSGSTRPSRQALSDAQRSFVDLAFRMAVVEVWHQVTGKTITMIIETPEGAVDIAYMERVATMLRAFASKGHTLLVTTNLNNEIFLPEILAIYQKNERMERVLNLLKQGRPKPVQKSKTNQDRFNGILSMVETHSFVK